MIGVEALVPPTRPQPPAGMSTESYTASPSAVAATSLLSRCLQPRAGCHAGLSNSTLQPPPDPLQPISSQPRALVSEIPSSVPPTATTVGTPAGNGAPPGGPPCSSSKPKSPVAAVTTIPGC